MIKIWWLHAHSGPNISSPTPKFKILLNRLFSPGPKVSKKVCHTCVWQKLREEVDFSRNMLYLAQGHTLEASWSDTPAQKLRVRRWTGPEVFIKILSFHQKLLDFLIWMNRHTDRQTDTCPPYGWVKFLMPFLIPFTSEHSLCSLHWWRRKNSYYWRLMWNIVMFLTIFHLM